jgi:Sap-like sulfolipid-1-addressing protein
VAVLLFAVIESALIILPLILLVFRPEGTAAALHRFQDWLSHRGRSLVAYIALVVGAYLAISSLVSLLG